LVPKKAAKTKAVADPVKPTPTHPKTICLDKA